MRPNWKRVLGFIVVMLVLGNFSVESKAEIIGKRTWNGFVYTGYQDAEYDDTMHKSTCHLTILNYKGTKTEVTIPTKIDGMRVTEVISLSKAKNLKILHIPNGVDVHFALADAPKLKKITVRKDNKKYSAKNNALLNKKGTILMGYPGGYSIVKVPDCVTKINVQAFYGSKFKSVKSGKKLKKIGDSAFSQNENIRSFVSGEKLELIGSSAFFRCKKLNKVILHKSVRTIEAGAFSGCDKLKAIYIYNPKCKIDTSTYYADRTIPDNTTIYGKKGSTAEKYAKQFHLKFKEL